MTLKLGNLGDFKLAICETAAQQAVRANCLSAATNLGLNLADEGARDLRAEQTVQQDAAEHSHDQHVERNIRVVVTHRVEGEQPEHDARGAARRGKAERRLLAKRHRAAEKRELHRQHAQHGEREQGEEDPRPLHRSDENE